MAWVRKLLRRWRRSRLQAAFPGPLEPQNFEAVAAILHRDGPLRTPVLATVLRRSEKRPHVADTEIRGFLDGTVKFRRNVATQYHVRVGCESSKPEKGRYEVMRLLLRWDLGGIPAGATIHEAALKLVQEDTTSFPHRQPLLWPVDLHLHATRKRWGPGLGGTRRDNQSDPEPGDAWWLAAREGEEPWSVPGCGLASDTDPRADRGAAILCAARLSSPTQPLLFTGPALAAEIERCVGAGVPLDLLVKATDELEARPGSVRAFYSSELGPDALSPRRPSLTVRWSAPAARVEQHPVILLPGEQLELPLPREAEPCSVLAARRASSGPIENESDAVAVAMEGPRLLATSTHPCVSLGEPHHFALLETWAPDVAAEGKLVVHIELVSPSGRHAGLTTRPAAGFQHEADLELDELGLWRLDWSTTPDRRFPAHRGNGFVLVKAGDGNAARAALAKAAEKAMGEIAGATSLLERRQLHFRLTRLGAELARVAGSGDGLHEDLGRAISCLEEGSSP